MTALRQFLTALRVLAVLTVLLGIAYPLLLTAGATAVGAGDGQPIVRDGHVVGSALLGQPAAGPEWFAGRPSLSDSAGTTSGGSNLSPRSPALRASIDARRAALLAANPQAVGPVPDDALTASASGLDPEISPAYAQWQVPRIAAVRGVQPADVQRAIDWATHQPVFGAIGEVRVNVTEANAELARTAGTMQP